MPDDRTPEQLALWEEATEAARRLLVPADGSTIEVFEFANFKVQPCAVAILKARADQAKQDGYKRREQDYLAAIPEEHR